MSVISNRRTDSWGGDLINRARFIRLVTTKVRARVSPEFIVGVRLSPEDNRAAKGLDLNESIQVAQWLCEDGIDFLHLSLWNWRSDTLKRPGEHTIPIFKSAIPKSVRLLAAGDIWTGDDAEAVLELGADGVAIGRAAVLDVDWPLIVSEGHRALRIG